MGKLARHRAGGSVAQLPLGRHWPRARSSQRMASRPKLPGQVGSCQTRPRSSRFDAEYQTQEIGVVPVLGGPLEIHFDFKNVRQVAS